MQARMVEQKAERENYKNWVGFQLDSFAEEGRDFLELPPCDSMHRIIAKDEARVPVLPLHHHREGGLPLRAARTRARPLLLAPHPRTPAHGSSATMKARRT